MNLEEAERTRFRTNMDQLRNLVDVDLLPETSQDEGLATIENGRNVIGRLIYVNGLLNKAIHFMQQNRRRARRERQGEQ